MARVMELLWSGCGLVVVRAKEFQILTWAIVTRSWQLAELPRNNPEQKIGLPNSILTALIICPPPGEARLPISVIRSILRLPIMLQEHFPVPPLPEPLSHSTSSSEVALRISWTPYAVLIEQQDLPQCPLELRRSSLGMMRLFLAST
jgi:hypothetical protein